MVTKPLELHVPLSWVCPESIAPHHRTRGYVVLNDSNEAGGHEPKLIEDVLAICLYANVTLGHLSGQAVDCNAAGDIDFGLVHDNSGQTLEQRLVLWLDQLGIADHHRLTLFQIVVLIASFAIPFYLGQDLMEYVLVRILDKISTIQVSRSTNLSKPPLRYDPCLIEDVLRHVDLILRFDKTSADLLSSGFLLDPAHARQLLSLSVATARSALLSDEDNLIAWAQKLHNALYWEDHLRSDSSQHVDHISTDQLENIHNHISAYINTADAHLQDTSRNEHGRLYTQLQELVNDGFKEVQQIAREDLVLAINAITTDVNAALEQLQQSERNERDAYRAEAADSLEQTYEGMTRLLGQLSVLGRGLGEADGTTQEWTHNVNM